MAKFKIAILISGNGSNLQAIIDAIAHQKLNIHIQSVISDNPTAYGLTRAKHANIPTYVIDPNNYQNKQAFEHDLIKLLQQQQVDLIVLAGFMRMLSAQFIQAFPNKIINIHPALLPKYKGLNTHVRVLAAQEKEHGVSVHFVNEEMDSGPIIAQARLVVHPNDTPETLKTRIHQLEHQLYPLVISWFAENRLHLTKDGIVFDQKLLKNQGVLVETIKD